MYGFVPGEIITNRNQIAAFIANIIESNFKSSLDCGEISYDEYIKLGEIMLSYTDDELYNFYEEFISGLVSRALISFIRKSVKASYGGGLFGLSSAQKKDFTSDLRKALR